MSDDTPSPTSASLTRTCRHPDHDCPKLMCGHPLPCAWHTAIIDTTTTPATVTIPVTSEAILQRESLGDIACALCDVSARPGS